MIFLWCGLAILVASGCVGYWLDTYYDKEVSAASFWALGAFTGMIAATFLGLMS